MKTIQSVGFLNNADNTVIMTICLQGQNMPIRRVISKDIYNQIRYCKHSVTAAAYSLIED